MSPLLRLIFWFALGVAVAVVPMLSYASDTQIDATPGGTVPATPTYTAQYFSYTGTGSTPVAACQVMVDKFSGGAVTGATDGGKCVTAGGSYGSITSGSPYSCATGTLTNNTCTLPASCPEGQNWTLQSGQNPPICTRPACVAPQVRSPSTGICTTTPCGVGEDYFGGACVPTCTGNDVRDPTTGKCGNPCPAAGQSGTGDAAKGAGFTGAGASVPASVCIGGCSYSAGGGLSVIAGGYYSTSVGRSLGVTCTGNSGAVSSGDLAAKCVAKGQGFATVNGVIVCSGTQGTASQPVTTKTPSSSKSVAADGTVTTTEKIETKVCDGSECTITVEAGGGSTSETAPVKEATPGSAEFCANNPDSPLCSTPDPCKDNPERAGCKELGTPTEEGALTSKAIGVSAISAVSLSQNLSCPADITLPRSMGLSWKPICDSADMLRPLILAFAWLGAGYIVMGAAKNG